MHALFLDNFYSSEYFEETTNVRDFGADSLWANIGGYVGMILGFSLYQAPEVISAIFRDLQTERTKYLHKKKIKGNAAKIDPETSSSNTSRTQTTSSTASQTEWAKYLHKTKMKENATQIDPETFPPTTSPTQSTSSTESAFVYNVTFKRQ